MTFLFWFSAFLIVYIYIGYPLLLKCLARRSHTPVNTAHEQTPPITIIIPAFNEADVIESTIRDKLEQDYPAASIEIIVVSDASDDGTDEIVQAIAQNDDRIKLIRQEPRQGKTAGLNKAVAAASNELIVFCDANGLYDANALKALAHSFEDPDVGYVTGKMVYVNPDGSLIGDGCSSYMKYENHLRHLETEVSSVVGVDGGIDAIRKSLYQDMSSDQLPDFILPLKVIAQHRRVIYQPEAILKEQALGNTDSEFSMRVRVTLRALWAMWDMRILFNPFHFGIFSLQLLSHKLLRYLAFLPMIILLLASLSLSGSGLIYSSALIAQILIYGAAIYTHFNQNTTNRFAGLAYYFCLINIAASIACFRFLKGDKITLWKPRLG